MAGVFTISADVQSALDLKEHHVLWLGVGRTTAWENGDDNPPNEERDGSTFVDIRGYVKANPVQLAKRVPNGTPGSIVFNQGEYLLVDDDNAQAEQARFLYVHAELRFDDFPLITFRQTGIFTDLTTVAGIDADAETILLPEQVSDNGVLIYYRNHTPRFRDAEVVDTIELIIEYEGLNLDLEE